MNRHFRNATQADLADIMSMLRDDQLGQAREEGNMDQYQRAFAQISADPQQHLMVIDDGHQLIATCHLTIMPSLTFQGTTRLQVEAVRVKSSVRGQGVGHWMMQQIIELAKQHDVGMIQLSTNRQREQAQRFYEQCGFEATHVGMKMML